MHVRTIGAVLHGLFRHLLWNQFHGGGEVDHRATRLLPGQLPPRLACVGANAHRGPQCHSDSMRARLHTPCCWATSQAVISTAWLPDADGASKPPGALGRSRQRAYHQHCQLEKGRLIGGARTGVGRRQASERVNQRQGSCLTEWCRMRALFSLPYFPPVNAANAGPMTTRSYAGTPWVRPLGYLPITSMCGSVTCALGGLQLRNLPLRATAQSHFGHSPFPVNHSSGMQTKTLSQSSFDANKDSCTLDGIIPITKPKGPTSGDVCLQVAKLWRLHREAVLAGCSRLTETGGAPADHTTQGPSRGAGGGDHVAARQRTGVGHGGTLDPAASGVLVLAVGKGTKLLHKFLTGSKGYRAVVKLGVSTDTLDSSGVITGTCGWSHVSRSLLQSTIQSFVGKQLQQPPLYSAKRIRGVRMYHIARNLRAWGRPSKALTTSGGSEQPVPNVSSPAAASSGGPASLTLAARAPRSGEPVVNPETLRGFTLAEVADGESARQMLQDYQTLQQDALRPRGCHQPIELPKPCEVEIYAAKLVEASHYELPLFEMEVYCSKGTYIRQLAADIAARCRTVAHVVELARIYQAPFHLADCVPLAELDLATLRRRLLRAEDISKLIEHKGVALPES